MKYKGRELQSVHIIIRRLIAYPFMLLFGFLFCVSIALCYGIDEGVAQWKRKL